MFFNFLSFFSAGSSGDNNVSPQKRKADEVEDKDLSTNKSLKTDSPQKKGPVSISFGKKPLGAKIGLGGGLKVAPIKISLNTQVWFALNYVHMFCSMFFPKKIKTKNSIDQIKYTSQQINRFLSSLFSNVNLFQTLV